MSYLFIFIIMKIRYFIQDSAVLISVQDIIDFLLNISSISQDQAENLKWKISLTIYTDITRQLRQEELVNPNEFFALSITDTFVSRDRLVQILIPPLSKLKPRTNKKYEELYMILMSHQMEITDSNFFIEDIFPHPKPTF